MSSGVSGVSGAGGVGGASSGGSSGGGVGGGVAKVNGAAGATSVGKGKGATVTEGDGNMVGNSQTQNLTHNEFHNHYGMSTQDFCSTRSMGGSSETQSAMQIGEIDMEALQKMMMAMIIMKILEAFMNNSDGSGAAPAAGGAASAAGGAPPAEGAAPAAGGGAGSGAAAT